MTIPQSARTSRPWSLSARLLFLAWTGALAFSWSSLPASAQSADSGPSSLAEAVLETADGVAGEAPTTEIARPVAPRINLFELMTKGGYLMLPILVMSLLMVTFGLERLLGLRRRKVLPPRLLADMRRLAESSDGFDLHEAYRLCRRFPSTASRVFRAMLLKVGRPHGEVERAVAEASEREAARLYSNVRWLSLAAGITPLLGLLGTVWGMIQAFFATANLPAGAAKADYLAQGICVALVTTFAGLAVAIPAAILAHYFEGRIQRHFRDLEEVWSDLLPRLEPFEGRIRVNHAPSEPAEMVTTRPR